MTDEKQLELALDFLKAILQIEQRLASIEAMLASEIAKSIDAGAGF